MGITKIEGFEAILLHQADVLKTLGHPARLAILQYLANTDSCICGDIVDAIPLAQPTISRHLSELRDAGLIKGTISGKSICYCLNNQTIEVTISFLESLKQRKSQNDCC